MIEQTCRRLSSIRTRRGCVVLSMRVTSNLWLLTATVAARAAYYCDVKAKRSPYHRCGKCKFCTNMCNLHVGLPSAGRRSSLTCLSLSHSITLCVVRARPGIHSNNVAGRRWLLMATSDLYSVMRLGDRARPGRGCVVETYARVGQASGRRASDDENAASIRNAMGIPRLL